MRFKSSQSNTEVFTVNPLHTGVQVSGVYTLNIFTCIRATNSIFIDIGVGLKK